MSGKKSILNLPLKIILTQEGASLFIRQRKKLLKFRLADNMEEYGFSLNSFAPGSLQKMILSDYISKIEISLPEFVSFRQDIMDLSKLAVYSMLYRQFDNQVLSAILLTEVVKKYNRVHPAHILDEKTKMNESVLASRISQQNELVSEAKKVILEPVFDTIACSRELQPEEKNLSLLLAEKFIDNMRPYTWYIILKFCRSDGFDEIVNHIRRILGIYMEKSTLAEYIALMVMELAVNSENTNLRKEAKIMYRGIMDDSSVIYDPEIRKKVIAELQRKHELVFISWKLGGGSTSIGTSGRLQVTLYNKDDEFQEIKENIETKKSADLRKKTLIDFYKEIPEGQEDTNLGLYYLSYLNEACEKVNVKFESLVNQFRSTDLTVIDLVFYF